ncbi:hypothetical protein [Flammeovirga sp. SJP92]|uniref:hypothetical protein n=1 Tax=Flammeovirga sp. SJP92 TaxID=1775430 RepID=UPI00078930E7|nr:hypothetical protein [Flammeovirga sp. SJP92]KXX69465.1 hypothetical protein AVL50_19125 [Flammeovirga sp. SJP92]
MNELYKVAILLISFFTSSNFLPKQEKEVITVSNIGYDPYGRDCSNGIYTSVMSASVTKSNIGKVIFLKPSDEKYILPDGLIAPENEGLIFIGHFEYDKCIHYMGKEDGLKQESFLFFVYDSIKITCPYNFWIMEKMKMDTQTCGRLKAFHERISVIKR